MNGQSGEQEREFWARYGFTSKPFAPQYATLEEPDPVYVFDPEGKLLPSYPPIDLNNLFKYAEPKLLNRGWYISIVRVQFEDMWRVELHNPTTNEWIERKGEVLKDVAFEAIWESKYDR